MRTLGMIGGTSWHSTIEYYRLVNELVEKEKKTNPDLVIYSLNIQLMREQDLEKINSAYLKISKKLQKAGAEAILICANTPHMVYDHVQPKIDIPILHIADATGIKAKKSGLKKLGLLGTRPTMRKGFLQNRLKEKFGIETIIPEEEDIDKVHYYISEELTRGKFTQEAKDFYLHQINLLKERGAEGIILGCTELPMLLEQKDSEVPLLATTDLHARMASDFILEK